MEKVLLTIVAMGLGFLLWSIQGEIEELKRAGITNQASLSTVIDASHSDLSKKLEDVAVVAKAAKVIPPPPPVVVRPQIQYHCVRPAPKPVPRPIIRDDP